MAGISPSKYRTGNIDWSSTSAEHVEGLISRKEVQTCLKNLNIPKKLLG